MAKNHHGTEREAEEAASAAVDAAAAASGKRSATMPFRRDVRPLRSENAHGQFGEIKRKTWSAKRIRRAAIERNDLPVAGGPIN